MSGAATPTKTRNRRKAAAHPDATLALAVAPAMREHARRAREDA